MRQTPHNYHRALVWTAVMTAVTHLDPHFGSVFAIEAVNGDYTCGSMCAQPDMPRVAEPIMNASQTPGYGDCEYELTKTVADARSVLGKALIYHVYSPEELRQGCASR